MGMTVGSSLILRCEFVGSTPAIVALFFAFSSFSSFVLIRLMCLRTCSMEGRNDEKE